MRDEESCRLQVISCRLQVAKGGNWINEENGIEDESIAVEVQ